VSALPDCQPFKLSIMKVEASVMNGFVSRLLLLFGCCQLKTRGRWFTGSNRSDWSAGIIGRVNDDNDDDGR
jgi:hypothetical protein